MPPNPDRVVIIGAGIVGLNVGLRLLHEGLQVHFMDADSPGTGASRGNAGIIGVEAAVPVGMPSVLSGALGYLLRQDGAAIVRPGYLLRASPWLFKFLLACRPDRVEEISKALHAISRHALSEYEKLFADVTLPDDIQRSGSLTLYRSASAFASATAGIDLRRRRGARVEVLSADEAQALEPSIGPGVHKALFFPDYASLKSPQRLCKDLAQRAFELGASFQQVTVTGISVDRGRASSLHLADGGQLDVCRSAVVIAAGAFSKRLAADVGCDLALDTERGYHAEIEDPGISLQCPVLVSDGAFYASTMEGRLRLAGTVEFAGLARAPDWTRADRMVHQARDVFPALRALKWSRWMGFRPSMPNSLPVIGGSPLIDHAYVACGHGHLGMTLGAITGTLIADLILRRPPLVNPAPYAPRARVRFKPQNLERKLHGNQSRAGDWPAARECARVDQSHPGG
jgi:D-amino-acid dehydrogenase